MAYDEVLAVRIRAILGAQPGYQEKKMFGGVGCMLHGNMACGVIDGDLIVRVGAEHDDLRVREIAGDLSAELQAAMRPE